MSVFSDKDECESGTHACDLSPSGHSECKNTDGGFLCQCQRGYHFKDGKCSNVNECSDPSLNDCDENSLCTDTDGSYHCTCNQGFKGNGLECYGMERIYVLIKII